jgi:hypothetical protein
MSCWNRCWSTEVQVGVLNDSRNSVRSRHIALYHMRYDQCLSSSPCVLHQRSSEHGCLSDHASRARAKAYKARRGIPCQSSNPIRACGFHGFVSSQPSSNSSRASETKCQRSRLFMQSFTLFHEPQERLLRRESVLLTPPPACAPASLSPRGAAPSRSQPQSARAAAPV